VSRVHEGKILSNSTLAEFTVVEVWETSVLNVNYSAFVLVKNFLIHVSKGLGVVFKS
jgi:hypothetical protein